jgi:hypothetical protein
MAKGLLKGEQADRAFAMTVRDQVSHAGFEPMYRRLILGFLVSVADSQYIGVLCSSSNDGESDTRIISNVHELARGNPHVVRIVVVKSGRLNDHYRERMKKSFNVDVISLAEISQYLREWAEAFEEDDDGPKAKPKLRPKRPITPAARLRSNATAIITITRSLAIQIDAKLESLNRDKPNSDDSRAAKYAAIAEYQELRTRVTELEKAVAKLKQRSPKTAPAIKAATEFGETVGKWWTKSGPKVLDKGADMSIVMTCASILALMGVDVAFATAVSAYVVSGRAPKGLFKSVTGH